MSGPRHMVAVGRRSLVSALAIQAALALGSAGALAEAADRKPPTAPRNLRVTGFGHYSVSLAWDASTDNSGFFTYWIQSSNGLRKRLRRRVRAACSLRQRPSIERRYPLYQLRHRQAEHPISRAKSRRSMPTRSRTCRIASSHSLTDRSINAP